MKFTNKHSIIVIAILVLGMVFAFVWKISFSVSLTGKLLPEREWLLRKWQDGTLIIQEQDYRFGRFNRLNTFQPDRGDLVEFRPAGNERSFLQAGDTIGHIYSNETMRQLNELTRLLNVAKSELDITRSGEKEALIAQAEEQWRHAQEQYDLQNKILRRKKELIDKQLIAREEYEIAESTADMLRLEIRIAESNLAALKTGAKPEEIKRFQTEISDLEAQIDILEQRLRQFTFVAPFAGDIFHVYSTDTLFVLGDTGRIVLVPIGMTDIVRIRPGQVAEVTETATQSVIAGKVARINNMVQYIQGSATQVGVIELPSEARYLPVNTLVKCKIMVGKISLMGYIGQQIRNFLN